MGNEKVNRRLLNGPVKVMLGAIAVSVIGWIGYASLHLKPSNSSSSESQDVESGVVLLPVGAELSPRTIFRVRFDMPMVETGNVGLGGLECPLIFSPPLKGKFVWDSTRSGHFTPADIFPLDTEYTITLRQDLAKGNGLELRRHFLTLPMRLEDAPSQLSLPSERQFVTELKFNVPMDPANAKSFVEFVSADGAAIPARLEAPRAVLSAQRADDDTDSNIRTKTYLTISPTSLLAGGAKWQLVLRKGLPSADGKNRFAHTIKIDLGMREPMKATDAHANNRLNHKRTIEVSFNRMLSQKEKNNDYREWLVVEEFNGNGNSGESVRAKINYEAASEGRYLLIKGDFEIGRKYRVRLKPGLPSRLGFRLASEWSDTVVFSPLPSRVYLPDTLTSQATSGQRLFGFVSVNNRAVRLRVKWIASDKLMSVLNAYRHDYLGGGHRLDWSGTWIWRDAQPLNYDLVPGKQVHENIYRPSAAADQAVKEEFSWDEVLGDRRNNEKGGALFVSLESVGQDGTASSAQAVVQLTDVGIAWKEAGGQMFLHAFSLHNAMPLAGAAVRVTTGRNESLCRSETDAEGNVILSPKAVKNASRWVTVTHQGDQHTMQLDRYYSRIPLWSFGIHRGWGDDENLKTYLFTDRLVYQPGDIVRLKGHVREWYDGKLQIPFGNLVLPVETRDPRGHVFYNDEVTLSTLGSFDLEIQLAKGVSGGHVIKVGGKNHYIDVFEYEPSTFKVRFPGRSQFSPDESIEVPLQVGYYFGKPLSGAKVKWTFEGRSGRHWPAGWDEFSFGAHDFSDFMDFVGEGTLSAKGALTIRPEVNTNRDMHAPLRGLLSVRITDANLQTIVAATSVTQHSSDYYLGLRELSEVHWAGQPLALKVVAVNPTGKSAGTGISYTATLNKIEWHIVKMKGAGGAVRFQNRRKLKQINEAKLRTIGRNADPVVVPITPPESGQYELVLRGEDSQGRPMLTSTEFYVSGEQPQAWDYENEFQMDLVTDKSLYHSGDTANILLKAPISGVALVTVEREKVLRSFQVTVSGNAPVIKVPLSETDAPNVFVSVMLLRGAVDSTRKVKAAEYRLGYCELKVERKGSRLQVKAKLFQADYRPGQEVETAVQVNDCNGVPVRNAEVTLYAVDEGILDLTGDKAPNLHEYFYQPRPLQVSTSSSFPFMRTEDPSRVHYGNKGHLIGGGGSGKGKLRRNFLAVAFWNATLQTDDQGQVHASFTAPDSLTRYRLFAVAHKVDQFGTGEAGFRINLPLMVESALPRFGRVGDHLTAKAMVYNQTDEPISALVQLEIDKSIIAKGKTKRRVTIPAQGSLAVKFPLEFSAVGRARTVWRVQSVEQHEIKDARETHIDIRHVAPLRRAVHFVRLDDAEADLLKPLDPALRQAEGTYTVGVSTSPMAELETAADYLLGYPHGCVEQTSSGLLPWLLLEDFDDVFPQLNRNTPKAKETIEYGINRLLSMQTYNGGLGYWPGQSASDFGSAYGGMVLAIAKARGQTVPSRPLGGLKKYLIKFVKRPADGNWGDHCLALYALTLLDAPQAAIHEKAFEQRGKMPESARILLSMAVAKVGGPNEMVDTLLKPTKNRESAFGYYGSANQKMAMRLLARSRQNVAHKDASKIAAMLAGSSRRGHWGTTFGNAWAIYAFSTYASETFDNSSVSGTLVWGDQEHSFDLNEKQRGAVFTFQNKSGPEEMPLILRNPGKGVLFVRVKAAMYPTAIQTLPVSQGLSLSRKYTRLKDDGTPDPGAALRVGDLVRVSLRVDIPNSSTDFLAIEDGLPACLEPVNMRLRTQRTGTRTRSNWFIDHQVLRKDRAVFYADHMDDGLHRIEYLARVRAAGQSVAPAAKAEAMYDPDTIGLSASQLIVTLPMDE